MTNDKTKYASVEPVELDIELTDELVCSYAHHNTAEPCWGAVVFRGIAPTCVGHSKMMSDKFYLFQDRVEKGHTTGGTLRLSINRGSKIPEELKDMWGFKAPELTQIPTEEVSVVLFPDMVRPETPKNPPPPPKRMEVLGPDYEKSLTPRVRIAMSDDTEIPEVWKDYL